MSKRKWAYRLWEEDGKWHCEAKELKRSFSTGDTPEAALKDTLDSIVEFHKFRDHLHEACEPLDCEYCKKGKVKRGVGGPYVLPKK